MEEIEKLASWIQESKHLVFFGGAGTSTDSGIKDFRGKNGLYQENFHGYSRIAASVTLSFNISP